MLSGLLKSLRLSIVNGMFVCNELTNAKINTLLLAYGESIKDVKLSY
jgi:hypothetical protein